MVQSRDDVVGLDSAVILPTETWKASGHVETFTDPLVECTSCHKRYRADHLEEAYEAKHNRPPTSMAEVVCTNCGNRGQWTEPRQFSGLLKTYLGVVESEEGLHYLRPETAQGIFLNFANVMNASRKKPPFGIGQVGKSFRNEITPGNFIFRTREFEQMEMEFFVEPGSDEEWHEYWLKARWDWWVDLGIDPENLRLFEHPKEKLSHYSKRTVDIEYKFRFGGQEFSELEGIANRTDFDLKAHSAGSGVDLTYFDQEKGERWTPFVIEPAAGLTRAVLAFLLDAYHEDEAPNAKGGVDKRSVLRLDPRLVAGQGRGASVVAQRRSFAEGEGPRRAAAAELERRVRRRGRDRPSLPAPGRDRYAVLRDGRLRDPRRPGRDDPLARHDGPGAGGARPGADLVGGAAPGLLKAGRQKQPRAWSAGLPCLPWNAT